MNFLRITSTLLCGGLLAIKILLDDTTRGTPGA